MAKARKLNETQLLASQPLWTDLPYRALVPIREDGNQVTLYRVAGSAQNECGPESAMKLAFDLYGATCYLCSKRIAKADFSIDHIEPRAAGGCGSLQNLAIAHKKCNQAKASDRLEAYSPTVGKEWLAAVHRHILKRLKATSS